MKGHQDAQQPAHTLPWPAQLNVNADREASNYVYNEPPKLAHFLPSAQIHLRDLSQRFIVKRWHLHLKTAYYQRNYENWLIRQCHWTRSTLDTVDFHGLATSIRCLPSHLQRFVQKWINHCLPTRRRVHRYDRHIPATCKSCPVTIEDDYHLLQCPSDHRRQACHDAYINLDNKLTQLYTHPDIHASIIYLVSMAFDIPTCHPSPSNSFLQQQLHLGPPLLFMQGRWAQLFRLQQENFYRHQGRPVTFTGDRWIRHLLCHLFEQLHSIWQCRNTQTHGADQDLQDKLRRDQLTIRATALYNSIPQLLAHDRTVFESLPLDDLLSGPTSSIATWLQMAEPTIQRCLRDAAHKLHTNQRDIRDFFDEASYSDSEASDTTLSFDTLATSETISFYQSSDSSSSMSSSSDSSVDLSVSSGFNSGMDGSHSSPT